MDGYGSRKFIVTMAGMIFTVVLAMFSKIDANSALVLGAAISAYNWANVKHSNGENHG